jgi:hypothetical protein
VSKPSTNAASAAQAAHDARKALDAAKRRLADDPQQAMPDYRKAAAEFHAASRIARNAARLASGMEGGGE